MQRIGTVDKTAQGLGIVALDTADTPDIGLLVIDQSPSTAAPTTDILAPAPNP